jgi:hypothetical protein
VSLDEVDRLRDFQEVKEEGYRIMGQLQAAPLRPPKMIIGMDPGGTTGLAWWIPMRHTEERIADDHWGIKQMEKCNEDLPLKYLMMHLSSLTTAVEPFLGYPTIHLVYEPFEFRKDDSHRDKIDYTPAEVVGALRYWMVDRPHIKLVRSPASLGKGFWTDEKIKKLGLWESGSRHAMDAMRHLLRYRAFELNHLQLFEPLKPTA